MGKKQTVKVRNANGRGPIARRVIASARQQMERKVANLAEWREATISAENFQKTVISRNRLAEYDPCHGLYIYGQNQLSVLIEQIVELPQLEKLADAYAEAEEIYMPSGPPMSPLTRSYFSSWGAFDLRTRPALEQGRAPRQLFRTGGPFRTAARAGPGLFLGQGPQARVRVAEPARRRVRPGVHHRQDAVQRPAAHGQDPTRPRHLAALARPSLAKGQPEGVNQSS